MLPVRVEAKSGRIFELALDDSMTVADLEEVLDYPTSDYKLIHGNRPLDGSLPLKSLLKSRKAPYIDLKIVPRSLKNLPRPRTPCTTEGSSFVFDGFSWYVVNQPKAFEPTIFQAMSSWIQGVSANEVVEFFIKLFLGIWFFKDQIGLRTGILITVAFILATCLQERLRGMLTLLCVRYSESNGIFRNRVAHNVFHFMASIFPEFGNDQGEA